jgi:MscS family membrane protein
MNIMRNIIKFIALMVFFSAFSFVSYAQNDLPEVTLKTPYNTVHSHLFFLQSDTYNEKKSAKTLYADNITEEKAISLAKKLKKYMDAKGLYVKMENVPEAPDYIDTNSGEHKYVLFESHPDIFVERSNGKWYYSMHTVSLISDMYDEAFPPASRAFVDRLPDFMKNEFIGLEIWKYFGLLVYLILGWVVYKIFSWIFGYFVARIFSKFEMKEVFNKYIRPIARPLSFLFVIIMVQIFISALQLPVKLSEVINITLDASVPVILIVVLYRATDLLSEIMAKLATKTATTVDDNLVPLVRKVIKIAIIILGVIYFISTLGWDVTPLIAGASVGGLAFALAAQDTIKNLFGSVTIFTDQPFEIGDWIVFDGNEGMVEEVGVRSTRIRTFYNSLISVPNGKLSDALIDNMGRREYRRFFTKISITYDTPTELIDVYVEGLKQIVENHPNTRKDYYQIHLNELGAASINILFYIFFKVPDWGEELKARHQVISDAIQLAEKLGVRFAFPTQTIHIEEIPGQKSLTPVYNQSKEDFEEIVKQYNEEKKKLTNK